MPSRTEATRAKAALCATGRLTLLRLFSTLPVCSPKSASMSGFATTHNLPKNGRLFILREMAIFRQLTSCHQIGKPATKQSEQSSRLPCVALCKIKCDAAIEAKAVSGCRPTTWRRDAEQTGFFFAC